MSRKKTSSKKPLWVFLVLIAAIAAVPFLVKRGDLPAPLRESEAVKAAYDFTSQKGRVSEAGAEKGYADKDRKKLEELIGKEAR